MQLYQTVSHDFKEMQHAEELIFLQSVHDKMSATGSAFPTPTTAYTIFQTKLTELGKSLGLSLTKVRGSGSTVKAAIKAVEVIADEYARYVNGIAVGSQIIIESAGFHATAAESVPGQPTEQPTVATNNPDAEGCMEFEFGLIDSDNIDFNLIIASDLSGVKKVGKMVTLSPIAGVTYFTACTRKRKLLLTSLPTLVKLYAMCYTTNVAGDSILSKIIYFHC
jgi:hypothetical protein